jgi:hypothetical protein
MWKLKYTLPLKGWCGTSGLDKTKPSFGSSVFLKYSRNTFVSEKKVFNTSKRRRKQRPAPGKRSVLLEVNEGPDSTTVDVRT